MMTTMPRRLVQIDDHQATNLVHVHLVTKKEQHHESAPHWHVGIELTIVFAGAARHQFGDNSWDLGRGDALLIGGSQAHEPFPEFGCRMCNWLLSPEAIERLQQLFPQLPDNFWPPTRNDRQASHQPWVHFDHASQQLALTLSERADSLCRQADIGDKDQELLGLTAAMMSIYMSCWQPSGGYQATQSVVQVIQSIHDQPARKWSRDELCQRTGLDRNSLTRQFREKTGLSPTAYVLQTRLKLAQSLLSKDDYSSVAEVGCACGFNNTTYFSRQFQNKFGLSPTEWHQRQQNQPS